MSINDSIAKALEPFVKDEKQRVKATGEVATALDIAGYLTTTNDHLAMMRAALKVIQQKVMDPDCSSRDVAALTNRLQQFSAEVTTMEEKQRQEAKIGGSTNTGSAAATDNWDPSEV